SRDGIKLDAAASRWQRPAATRLSWSRLCRLLACREAKALDATTKTAMNSTTSGWLVLNRPQVAGFELPGDSQNDHLDRERQLPDGAGDFQAVEARHVDIENCNLRFQRRNLPHRFFSIGGFTHNFETRIAPNEIAKSVAKQRMVIYNEHCYVPAHVC